MEKNKYMDLRKRYPPYVSKDQLYIICNIAKKSAKYLLDNGIIPCIDNEKKTHRYSIALDDIITYLEEREKTGFSQIPRGAVSSRRKSRILRCSYSQEILLGKENEVRRYFEFIFNDYPDVLTSHDLSEMVGLSRHTVLKLLAKGEIKSFPIDLQHRIYKKDMLEFVTSQRFLHMKSNSEDYLRILGGFKIWKEKIAKS